MNIFSFSRQSILLLYYGVFAVLCHATFILLMCQSCNISSPSMLASRFFPMLEHSLMSFTAILFGVLAFEYVHRHQEK